MILSNYDDIVLPDLVRIRQLLENRAIDDISQHVKRELKSPEIESLIQPGMKIAIGVGSRGINHLSLIVKTVVDLLKVRKTQPFIVPAMGSHGGASAEGQKEILADYGISEELLGCPVCSSMDVVEVGEYHNGKLPKEFEVNVCFDKMAFRADGIIPINRIKPHSGFMGEIQSGLLKMMVIGFGNHEGASRIHKQGADRFQSVIPCIGQYLLTKTPVIFGIGIVEDSFNQPAVVEAIPADRIYEREKVLLQMADSWLPRLPLKKLDVLVIKEVGKNISGTGMDPHVIGRFPPRYLWCKPTYLDLQRLVVLDLTPESHGNAGAIGLADIITRNMYRKINFDHTYINSITASVVEAAKIPLVAEQDLEAICLAIKTCYRIQPEQVRMAIIKNTLSLEEFWISKALLQEVEGNTNISVLEKDVKMKFSQSGSLVLQ